MAGNGSAIVLSTLLYVGPWWDLGRQAEPPDSFEPYIKVPGYTTVNIAANYTLRDDVKLLGIGFGFLHYPVDASTILWGLVIGGAAIAASKVAMGALRLTQRGGTVVALSTALIGAYAAYELVLFAATPFLGGAEEFSAAIIGRLGPSSVLWLMGLVAACEAVRLFNPVGRRRATS